TVYTPLFSGVFWEAQDLVMEDIDRIEVISGPGATLWGANAVNGVINIITLSARRTEGLLAKALGGDEDRGAVLRHGAALAGGGALRGYVKYIERDGARSEAGADLGDDSTRLHGGFRGDWGTESSGLTLQGDAYRGEVDRGPMRRYSGANLLGRWRHQLADGSRVRVPAYYDRTDRRHADTFDEDLDTLDIEAQHALAPWAGHRMVWGGGYRHSRDRVENSAAQAFIPAEKSMQWTNLFVQDVVAVAPRLSLTLGLKAERNPYTGVEYLPNVRLAWQATGEALVWAALSRAVRAPSRLDREFFFPGNPPFTVVGSTRFDSEVARVAELGYRAQVSNALSVSATLYHHDYPNLRSLGPTDAGPAFLNDIEGRTTGLEAWGSYRVTPAWRLSGGFVAQDIERRVKPGAVDLGSLGSLGTDPKRKVLLRSIWDVTARHEFDLALRHIGRLPEPAVPAYTVVDARLAWRPSRAVELSLRVQNLLDRRHAEWGVAPNRAQFDRTYFVKLVWTP
ncbi:MAG TPA: TonB-dependent receptor, partial [Gemmatimonadales bacterium]|nr:TonB-dependent receptor [Gemmatimonadales bacterium]